MKSKHMGGRGEPLLGGGSEAERREEDWKRKIGSGHDRSGLTYDQFFRIERFFGRRSSFLGRTNVPIGLFDVRNFDRFFDLSRFFDHHVLKPYY
jgi:hypothetical protein